MDFKEEMQKLGLETLVSYVSPVRLSAYPIEGRNEEMMSILATFARKVVTNAILLGAPGTGKTAIVQGLARSDKRRIYLEVDLSLMATGENGSLEMAARLKQLFDEVEQYKQYMAQNSETAKEIVLFIDEFHRIIDMSATATEEIKPALAESGVRGIKILAATTFEEYEEKVAKNKALNDRLERVTIRELNKENVVKILYNLVRKHLTEEEVLAIDPKLFELVYEYTNRYNPSSPQPRKSILLVDRMLGYYSAFNKTLDEDLLAAVLYSGTGVNVKFQADAKMIKTRLDKRVFSQQFATSVLEKRLQICVSNLNDPSRPMSSFLFTGSTGVGKTEMAKGMSDLLFGDERALIRFDMSEFATLDAIDRFRDRLTGAVWSKPYGIILLDEIEKAEASVTRLLLQVLDDGRLSDRYGREVSFKNTYIIMTTNVASEVYKEIGNYASSDNGAEGMTEYHKVIRRALISSESFPSELINRIDVIVPFQPLSNETLQKIISIKLIGLQRRVMKEHHVEVSIDKDVVKYLCMDKYDSDTDSGGARGIVHQMDLEVTTKIAEVINADPKVRRLYVYIDGTLAADDKFRRLGTASVKVRKGSSTVR